MIDKVAADIAERVRRIERGSYGYDDLRLLFIDIRDSLPTAGYAEELSDSAVVQLRDAFNFAAHPNSRERGTTFKVSRKIIKEFVQAVSVGGSVNVALLDLQVSEALGVMLKVLDIPHDQARLTAQEDALRGHVFRLLDGVLMEVNEDAIESASVQIDEDSGFAFIAFKMRPFQNQIGNLTISGAPTMRFRLL
jgi:hypothetical protein